MFGWAGSLEVEVEAVLYDVVFFAAFFSSLRTHWRSSSVSMTALMNWSHCHGMHPARAAVISFFSLTQTIPLHSLQAGRRYPARVAASGGVRVLRGSYPGRVRGERRAG